MFYALGTLIGASRENKKFYTDQRVSNGINWIIYYFCPDVTQKDIDKMGDDLAKFDDDLHQVDQWVAKLRKKPKSRMN